MWQIIVSNLIPIVVVVLTPGLIVLGNGLFQLVAKKLHMDGVLKYEAQVDSWIESGIAAAEKASLNKIKLNQPPTPGEQKLQQVIGFVTEQLNQHELPQKSGDALAKIIDAKLFNGAATPLPPPVPAVLNG